MPRNLDKNKIGYLHLDDGLIFPGTTTSNNLPIHGEVVFTTAMAGYVESLTDPSYANQILVFTYPLIGNYGVQPSDFESDKIYASGVVVDQLAKHPSHTDSISSLQTWLDEQNVPLLDSIDTRSLTIHLREKGVMNGALSLEKNTPKIIAQSQAYVGITAQKIYNPRGKKTVVLVDCGAKDNILQSLLDLDMKVVRVPHDYDYSEENFDGVLLSNGPGDPENYQRTIEIVKKMLSRNIPIFGICLGNQIMGLAAGARTYKLRFGHRGQNQPCRLNDSETCVITSQNHGYALDEKSLPSDWKVLFHNLNDGSVEGIKHTKKPFFAVQFHPEAQPGPTDTSWLFNDFVGML